MSSIDNFSAGFAAGAERRFDSQTTSHGRWGEKLGRDAGASLEFMDYRAYVPGDDLRHIDWNAYGRTDRLIVKRFENEIQPHVDILLDTSRSMAITPQKQAAAEFLTGYFMGAAENSRFSCQLWRIKDGVFDRSTYRQLVTEQSAPMEFDSTTSLGATILESGPDWNAKTFKIILSDFLWEEDPFVRRTFTEKERKEAAGKDDPRLYFAGRFAAKEAVYKYFTEQHLEFHEMRLLPYAQKEAGEVTVENLRQQVRVNISYEVSNSYVLAYLKG